MEFFSLCEKKHKVEFRYSSRKLSLMQRIALSLYSVTKLTMQGKLAVAKAAKM